MVNPSSENGRLMRRAALAAVVVASGLVVLKAGAWAHTGSVALLGSLVDSLLDLVASSLNMFAVRHALAPADREHRFGHGKAEAVAGLAQAAIIAGSAAFLAFEAISRLIEPRPVNHGVSGIAVMGLSIVATFGLVVYQRWVIRRTRSLAITADSVHYTGDLLVNASVIVALVLAEQFGLPAADPVFALGIAAFIAYNAWTIWRGAMDMIMDSELPDADRARIRDIVLGHDAVEDMHDLRTRAAGGTAFIQFHIELDPCLTLQRTHDISDEVEAAVAAAFPQADIIIHADPQGIFEAKRDYEIGQN